MNDAVTFTQRKYWEWDKLIFLGNSLTQLRRILYSLIQLNNIIFPVSSPYKSTSLYKDVSIDVIPETAFLHSISFLPLPILPPNNGRRRRVYWKFLRINFSWRKHSSTFQQPPSPLPSVHFELWEIARKNDIKNGHRHHNDYGIFSGFNILISKQRIFSSAVDNNHLTYAYNLNANK